MKRFYQHPRNEDGQFQKQCGCSILLGSPEEKFKIFKICSLNCKKGYKYLVDEVLIDRHASYVCNVYLRYMPGNKSQWNVSDQGSMSSDINIEIDSDIREEESNNLVKQYQNLTHCKWVQLSIKIKESICLSQFWLGWIIEKTLHNDRLAISKEYKDTYKLKSGVPKLWLKNSHELELSFCKEQSM